MRISMKEADVLSACLQYLALRGILCWRSNNAGVFDPQRSCFRAFRGLKGVSDILGIVPSPVLRDGQRSLHGLFLAVEVKRPGGRPSDEQEWFLEEVRRRGGIGICARSVQELEMNLNPYLGG